MVSECGKKALAVESEQLITSSQQSLAHCLVKTLKFLAHHQTTIREHPTHSPDLAPNDFFLYLRIKEVLGELILRVKSHEEGL